MDHREELNEAYADRYGTGTIRQHAPAAEITSGDSHGAAPIIARAHHGSVAKQQRAEIESALKSGALRCVVTTSSLELGIDMGEIDLVIQVAAPPNITARGAGRPADDAARPARQCG